MDQVIIFDKSYQERLQEYLDIFSDYQTLTTSELTKVWSYYLELTLDISGWQAVWKISRNTCENLKISFPTVVLVYVYNVDTDSQNANVKILAVQDEWLHLPDHHVVPLIHLWPTKVQDKTVFLSIKNTAAAIDTLRFFYNNLYMPWDLEDCNSADWVAEHLEMRLKLFYDMKNGNIKRTMCDHIRSLITEAKRLRIKHDLLETEVPEEVDVDKPTDKKMQEFLETHVRLLQIKNEFELLENPLTRNILRVTREGNVPEGSKRTDDVQFWIVYDAGKADDFISFLKHVEDKEPNKVLKNGSSVDFVLESMNTGDTIILNQGIHTIKHIGGLELGGTLKGFRERGDSILTSNTEDIMLDISGEVFLENLTVVVDHAQCGIVVRRGKLTVKDCKIVSNKESSTHQGIIILNGGQLELIDSSIGGFCSAIVGNTGSQITLVNCDIHDVNTGLKVHDNCSVKMQCTTIRNCAEFGISVETANDEEKNLVEDFTSLKIIPNFLAENVTGENNKKGDVLICRKQRIQPVEDLFAVPSLNADKIDMEVSSAEDIMVEKEI